MLRRLSLAGFILLLLCGPVAAADEDDGEAIRRGQSMDDLFLTSGRVEVSGSVMGDVFATGGWVDVNADIQDDLIAAGGSLSLRGSAEDIIAAGGRISIDAKVADNVVATGGWLDIGGDIAGKLIAAGGNLDLNPDLTVAGDVMLAGGDVSLAGRINGDVSVAAGELRISPDTVIDGGLTYRGPEEPEIPEGAQIAGGVEFEQVEGMPGGDLWQRTFAIGGIVGAVMWIIGLSILAGALSLLFPRFFRAADETLGRHPWGSLGLGLAVLAATPVAILLLFVTVVGILPGLLMIPVYGIVLATGYLTILIAVARRMTDRIKGETAGTGAFIGFLVLTVIVFTLIGAIPFLGGLFTFIVLLLGTGVLVLTAVRAWAGSGPGSPETVAA